MNNPYIDFKKYEGMEFKYKDEFCPLLSLDVKTSGKAKKLQLNKLRQYMELDVSNRKIKIVKIYDENEIDNILDKQEFRYVKNKKHLHQFNVSGKNRNKGGVYKIQLNNKIYVGQTNNFYHRFKQHYYSETPSGELLKNGGVFSVLEFIDNQENRNVAEIKYIEKYVNNNNYCCVNKDFNEYSITNNKKYFKIKVLYKDYERVKKLFEKEGITYEKIK